jgi:phosphatidylglycerol:prolipoprotein diacylglycerol transferase
MIFPQEPDIDPVLVHFGGALEIRWYSLLYVGGFAVGWALALYFTGAKQGGRFKLKQEDVGQFIRWLITSAVVGARVAYCLVYDTKSFFANPLTLFQVRSGGLSFHGSLIAVILLAYFFSRAKKIPVFNQLDLMALCTPSGLAMGRLGNFINGELFGRPTTSVPWAMIFREGGPQPRHPSQLYEFLLEGPALFALLWVVKNHTRKDGYIGVAFVAGYGVCRFVAEFFREPDPQLGYLAFGLTMGQMLSLLQIALIVPVAFYLARKAPSGAAVGSPGKRV